MKRLALALLLTACGPARDAADEIDLTSEKGNVAIYRVLDCTHFVAGKKTYTLPEFPHHSVTWSCAYHPPTQRWEWVRVEFWTANGCYGPYTVETKSCVEAATE